MGEWSPWSTSIVLKHLFSSQLRRNMVSGATSTAMNAAVMFVSYPVYLHFLGYEKLGVWMVLSTVLTFVQMCNLGMGPAVTKLVAEEHARGNREGIQDYVSTASWTLIAVGTFALAMLLLFARPILGLFKLGTENEIIARQLLPYLGVLTVYAFVVQVLTATLSGLGRMDQASYRDSLCRVVSLGVSILFLILGYEMVSLLVGLAVSYLLMILMSHVLLRRLMNLRMITFTWDAARFKTLVGFGGSVLGSSILNMLLTPFNKLILSRYTGVESVAAYEIAFNMAMQIRALFDGIVRAIVPDVSRTTAVVDFYSLTRVKSLNARLVRLVWLYGGLFYGPILVCCIPVMKVWLGNRYMEAIPQAFAVFMLANLICLGALPSFYTLMGMGQVKYILLATVIQSVVNVTAVSSLFVVGGDPGVWAVTIITAIAMVCGAGSLFVMNRALLQGLLKKHVSCDGLITHVSLA